MAFSLATHINTLRSASITDPKTTADALDRIQQEMARQATAINSITDPVVRWDYRGELPSLLDLGGKPDDYTDTTWALIKGLQNYGGVRVPFGRWRFYSPLDLRDTRGLQIIGMCPGAVLVPDLGVAGNFIDVSGARDMILRDFQIDGVDFPDLEVECIYGDGTEANPVYGDISIINVLLSNWKNLGYGIGANAPMTAERISYLNCTFRNCGAGTHGANVIDTGSSGTKRAYRIEGCKFFFEDQPPSNPGNAIFAGHGDNENFTISSNTIYDSPSVGINIHCRPFIGETTRLVNFTVSNNIIYRSRWAGIAIFGGDGLNVTGNNIYNPGFAESATDETRCGILLSSKHSGATPDLTRIHDLTLEDNSIIDDQVSPTMKWAVLESVENSGCTTQGQAALNTTRGYSEADFGGFDPTTSFLSLARFNPGSLDLRVGFGDANFDYFSKARITADGDVRAEKQISSDNSLFSQLGVKSAVSAGGFLLLAGFNIRFDALSGLWETGADGSSNGWGAITVDYGSGLIQFHSDPSTGGTVRTYSTAAFLAKIWIVINPSTGTIRFNAADGSAHAVSINTSKELTFGQLDAVLIGPGTVSNTEFGYLDGLTGNVESRLAALEAGGSFVTISDYNNHVHNGHTGVGDLATVLGDSVIGQTDIPTPQL